MSKVLHANKMSDLTEVISDEVEATDNLVPRAKRASEEWVREIDTWIISLVSCVQTMRACLPVSILDTTVSLALKDCAYAHSHSNLDAISEDALSVKLIDSLIAPRVKFSHTDEVCLSDREDVSRLRIRGDLGII